MCVGGGEIDRKRERKRKKEKVRESAQTVQCTNFEPRRTSAIYKARQLALALSA